MTPLLLDHPLAADALAVLRRSGTAPPAFRAALGRIALLLAAEATRGLATRTKRITTPLEEAEVPVLGSKLPCLVPVLRAGLALLDGFQTLLPDAPVAHFGAWRDHETLKPVEYYFKAPADLGERGAIVLDPMLATGGTAIAAVSRLRAGGAGDVTVAAVLAAPEGVAALAAAHPEARVLAAALDRGLDHRGYIVPGLGDAGDRAFATS
ncbi:uracil phosphoribosyltransferase [Elioraea rosea]|uniref:uracil phosphoribosyltransferase n=1 Tax=Elioraea rosea TaxID=2492390 RepID=UPI001183AB88|nr:uracil phosphoribosyltransferase [Elioraea rosea]